VLWIEVDEHQHYPDWTETTYSCDEKRISDAYDEFSGKQLVVVRFNTDWYETPDKSPRKILQDRLEILKNLILRLLTTRPTDLIKIYYLFYSEDNPLIVENFPFELVYE
jgi:hypothetical protein